MSCPSGGVSKYDNLEVSMLYQIVAILIIISFFCKFFFTPLEFEWQQVFSDLRDIFDVSNHINNDVVLNNLDSSSDFKFFLFCSKSVGTFLQSRLQLAASSISKILFLKLAGPYNGLLYSIYAMATFY